MPWSKAQKRTAQAVTHGWKPKGEAKDFSKAFAKLVVAESNYDTGKKAKKKGKC